MSSLPPLVRLLRLPSVATVPGDTLLGAAWAQEASQPPSLAAIASGSCMLYLAGMALNDWADRERDACERPQRPIPAGEIAASTALAGAIALTGGALAATSLADGERRLPGAATLAGVVWLYDLRTKDTPAGPWTMALARALDVLHGASHPQRTAQPAALLGTHALLITLVSAHEAQGSDRRLIVRTLLGVLASTAVAMGLIGKRAHTTEARAFALACLSLYAISMGRAGVQALRAPDASHLQRLVGTGVLANMPLQAAMLAACGRKALPGALLAGWPLARIAARRAAVT